jgi:hypothetical protein
MSKVITPEFRASYCNVWEPGETPSGDLKYSISMIFPKETTNVDELRAAIKQKIVDTLGADEKKWPKGLKNPLRDGDTERDGEEYKGCWFMNAGSKNAPGVVGVDVKPIMDRDEFYSGCYARASINFFYFDQKGNRGVGVGLNNLMKTKDGERLDGRRSAEAEFADFAVEGASKTDATGF